MRKNLKLGVLLLALLIAVTAWTHNVPKSPTHDDIRVIHAMLEERGAGDLIGRVPATFEQEIDFIAAAQDAVLARAPENKGLPMGSTREPKSLYNARYGLCYDRSRAIEKALTLMNGLFSKSFVYLSGLYSRHGQFYPPFTPIPDVNWWDFIAGH